MTKIANKIIVKQSANPDEEIPFEVMAQSIKNLAELGKKIKASKLSQRAVLVLLRDMTGESMETIRKILDSLPELEKRYLK